MKTDWDVVVIGAGAAGLFAASTTAARGRSTLLIEKNRKLGVKILMSGGTRCNITQNTNWKGMATAFGIRQGRFLKFSLASLTPDEVVHFFNEQGVATKIESTGKIFPVSDRAIDVRDALVEQTQKNGAKILNESAVTSVRRIDNQFRIETASGLFTSRSLIVTTGGKSYPGCGTTGDGYAWLKEMGHTIEPPRPALTPLRLDDLWARDLSGITVPNVGVRIELQKTMSQAKEPRSTQKRAERNRYTGSFLFTHKGCSGPTVLNISRMVTDPLNNMGKRLICDWLPDMSEHDLRESLMERVTKSTGKQLGSFLSDHLPRRVVAALCQRSDIELNQPLSELGKKRVANVIETVKRCPLAISGTLGFAKAEVTAGGISLGEVDPQTMGSRLVPGLFVAGEILDIDGPIGGYNFQAAFSTGFVAGSNA